MARLKQKFCGIFNYAHEVHIIYRLAYSERQAWVLMCRKLAKIHEVSPFHVMGLFDGSRDNYELRVETEYFEIEETADAEKQTVNDSPGKAS